ncbi:MAG: hypothetical protein JSV79_03820, partial [Armatimonadota bacterium]
MGVLGRAGEAALGQGGKPFSLRWVKAHGQECFDCRNSAGHGRYETVSDDQKKELDGDELRLHLKAQAIAIEELRRDKASLQKRVQKSDKAVRYWR